MEQLFGDNLIILYFIVGLGVICYGNFNTQQKIMLMYTITYVCCLLNILDSKAALIMMTLLLFIYLEYLTEDSYKLKIVRKMRYKIADAMFLMIFQYYYIFFVFAVLLQTDYIRMIVDWKYYNEVCCTFSFIMVVFCIHETSIQRFETLSVTDVMKVVNQNPIYQFPYNEIDADKYTILTEIEDKSYFKRTNSYNFLSIEFVKYRLLRFRAYIKCYHGKEK